MMSVSPNPVVRSSLEEMLDSLRRKDENQKPKDIPPALPARPKLTPRARLPSFKRPLPTSVIGENEPLEGSSDCNLEKEEIKGLDRYNFGAKKFKEIGGRESPYDVASDEKEEIDNLEYFMKKKLRVWCRVRNGTWESGKIQSTSGDKSTVMLSEGIIVTVATRELLPANLDILEGVDDLMQLCYLNEPSVLENLQYRYRQDLIYSKAGPILVALNPFKDVELYGSEFITAYRQKLLDTSHVYSIADAAYNEMMIDEVNQSIIISGASGSGKTETAKFAIQYLTALSGSDNSDGIESKILHTSSILEAFGNSKTSKNENSSRFGKLMEIHFDANGKICGAKIQTFLLEKSRVVQVAQGERSYHIFYQLCAGAPSDLRGRLRLKRACEYNYLNQSDCLEIHDVNDAQKFHSLTGALNTLICREDQEHAFGMLAAILWLGNISCHVVDNENHIEVVDDEAVTNAASLLGCDKQDLMLALSTKNLTLQKASDSRDALAKFIYASLFDWIVEKINTSLTMEKQRTGRSISILDIYGFESFKKNGFEQFCRNYANERLQQHFNRHLFKLVQQEYESDGIDWTKIEFQDNQDCLDLLEKRPIGLISLLDEESNSPDATDLTFATKLKQHLNDYHCFKGESGGTFSIRHCAGEVLYDSDGFLEKNMDPFHYDTIQLLSLCTSRLPQLFSSTLLKKSPNSSISLSQKQSVATEFKGRLFRLLQHLESTRPHFIRCIKPNSKQQSGLFENNLVSNQIKSCGVLEAVRFSRTGYPIRMTHQEFATRYGSLIPEYNTCQDPLRESIAILQQFNIPPAMYQIGYTKVYFRSGQISALEDARKQIPQGSLEVEKCLGGNFHELKGRVIALQSYVRGENSRKEYAVLHELKRQSAGMKLDEQLMAVLQIQSVIRGWLVRKHFNRLKNLKLNSCKQKPGRRISELKDLPPDMLPVAVEELQKQLQMAEVSLNQKEKENASLKDQVQRNEARWSEYEIKMKSMEEMWQKQMGALQTNLAAAKKSLITDPSLNGPPRRLEGSQSPHFYDSDTSMGTQTPGGSTPTRLTSNGIETNGAVSSLLKEFEQRKQNFENEALAIVEVKSGNSHSANPVEELKGLKHRFEAWRKEYKVRLREAKAKALRHGDADKSRRKWWGKKTVKL